VNRDGKTLLKGILEIDHTRGVIYFHLTDLEEAQRRMVVTVLRVQGLPKPIPEIHERQLDIAHMVGCDWGTHRDPTLDPPCPYDGCPGCQMEAAKRHGS
jgi:hypothetical protein